MDITIQPGLLSGTITVPSSKSCCHRALICAALADRPTHIRCTAPGRDILATVQCLRALGAGIQTTQEGFHVTPIAHIPASATLPCGESGSTLRFLLPIVGALGVDSVFYLEGRLPHRPLSPLWEELERMGCFLSRPTANSLRCCGQLRPGIYQIDGSVSSQFITGLMLAMPLLPASGLEVTGTLHSAPYISITRKILEDFQVFSHNKFISPGHYAAEGDWSSAAFFWAANTLGSHTELLGLDLHSVQGDRAITGLLPRLEANTSISATQIPDLVPILSVVAACRAGAVFTDTARLRGKESDRVAAILDMITALGGHAEANADTITVLPTHLSGGIVDCHKDHRIAMAAAIAATVCTKPVTILGAECVAKSYPHFWAHFQQTGGRYELLSGK